MSESALAHRFDLAREQYAALGVDVENALTQLAQIPISLHCWQGDDVGGFENVGESLGGGLAVTGNYPGKARNAPELRADLELALAMIPGKNRLNLHALYAETHGKKIPRDELTPDHFANWLDWAKKMQIGVDFNPSCFSHPLASDGFTLTSRDKSKRDFWIRHCIASRKIGAAFGKSLGSPTVTNVWIPDGMKDTPVDRKALRELLVQSLDAVFAENIDPKIHLDAVEGKLFGIGSESFVVGSHEFYYGYALKRGKLVCLDAGHYHPTETIVDKISAVLTHLPEILLHVSRGVRWDSDHVVTLGDDLYAIAREIVVNGYTRRVHIGLDYFDASINRIAAWVVGTRSMQKALLAALLEPTAKLRELENAGDYSSRLVLQEEVKTLPLGPVWDMYCTRQNTPPGSQWWDKVKTYEKEVLSLRK